MTENNPILKIEDLTVAYRYGRAWLDAIRGVSLQIEPGQTYGLVGESGSGKTTLANAIMGYLGENSRVREGKIECNGRDISSLRREQMRTLWARRSAWYRKTRFRR
jgi:peptide/nickel transport system ATP-binding protein